jgi:2-C-methyl-D-erythritol 4-phosphate cytidylyltransferase
MPAAGAGTRLGKDRPKALVDLGGEPLVVRTLKRFLSLGLVEDAVVVVPEEHRAEFEAVLKRAFPRARFTLAPGGAERQASVANGLERLDPGADIVVIHDAARPFVTVEAIRASIDAAAMSGAATVAIPAADTILCADEDGNLADTPDRRNLWVCQTPQTFRVELLRRAHDRARCEGCVATDDATLVRRMGVPVRLVMGTPLNFKITTPANLALAACVIREGLA